MSFVKLKYEHIFFKLTPPTYNKGQDCTLYNNPQICCLIEKNLYKNYQMFG